MALRCSYDDLPQHPGGAVSVGRKLSVLLVPWGFLALFGAAYVLLLLPRLLDGHLAALCVGAFVTLVFGSFCAAAITFSRDVLTNRWPE
jgi:hypothetical protein